jgi:hypothetical protein
MIVKMICRSLVIHKLPSMDFGDQKFPFVIAKEFCRSRMIGKTRI